MNKIPRKMNVIKWILVIVGFALILGLPIIIFLGFNGSSISYPFGGNLFNLQSSLPVDFWAGFWVTYLSLLVTASLTIITIRLTYSIERNHIISDIQSKKRLLIVEKFELSLQLGQEARDIYIKLGFPLEAQGLAEEIYIQEASIQLGDINEKIYNCNEMQSQEKKHSSSGMKLQDLVKLYIPEEDCVKLRSHLIRWKYWEYGMTPGYETIKLIISFGLYSKFGFLRQNHQKFIITTKCSLKASTKGAQIIEKNAYLEKT